MINGKEKFEGLREAGPYLGLGSQLAVTMVAFFFLGYWLDGKFDTLPLFVIIFSMLGMFGGIYNFIRSVTQLNERKKENNDT